jgi:MtrB/PioB family decaheme-associated outer membrane protein
MASTPARAADDAVRELTQPTNTVEAGAGYVSEKSFKFGQYNGLYNQGLFGIFNLDVRGGGLYDSADPTRWSIVGTDLGLETRDVRGQYGQQGKFRIDAGFDQLAAKRSDSYQTPYLGAGSNTLTLPSDWVVPVVPQVNATAGNFRALSPVTGLASANVGGVVTPPTAAQQAIVNNIIAHDTAAFHNVDLGTERKSIDGGFTYEINPLWQFKVSAKHEEKTGTKALSMLSLAAGTAAVVLPDRIDQNTDQYNVALNYTGDKSFFQVAYYGSVFHNNVNSMTWQNPFIQTPTLVTMSSAPSNQFHQLLLTGGYNFTPTTKLVVNGSYARNTQDDAFVSDPGNSPLGLPTSSLHGLVLWKAFNAKLTAKPWAGLNLVAGYKFDDRDNHTPVNMYEFYDAGEPKASTASPFNAALGLPANTLGSNINIYANRPYSKKLNQFDLDADYAVAKGQTIRGSYQYQQIDRKCDGSWINCADAPQTRENTLRAEWRASSLENFDTRLSYAYSQRRVDYDENAWLALVPMANVVPAGGATVSAAAFLQQTGLGAFGPNAPWVPLQPGNLGIFFPNNSALPQALYGSRNDIHELPGMRRFNMADRNRDKARAAVNWSPNERFTLQGELEYNKDDYDHSVYGLKEARSWAANADGTYTVSEPFSLNFFYTYEDQRSQSAGASYSAGQITNAAFVGQAGNTIVSGGCFDTVALKNSNAKIDPCLNWSTDMRDKVNTVGAGFKYRGLASGRLDVAGDLVYTYSRTDVGVAGGTYANNPFALASPVPPLAPGVPAAFFISAADLPTVTTKTIELRLNSVYTIDRQSALRLLYWYQHLKSSDYAYDGMQYGTITSVIPTNETSPSYNVHVIGISYIYQWQ